MEILQIEATKYTPQIILDPDGYISIKGKSYPENSFEFYEPIIDWIENYFTLTNTTKTIIDIHIVYFNSSSSKVFFDIFDIVDEYNNSHHIDINWLYDKENENVYESGEDFIEDFKNLKINLISI